MEVVRFTSAGEGGTWIEIPLPSFHNQALNYLHQYLDVDLNDRVKHDHCENMTLQLNPSFSLSLSLFLLLTIMFLIIKTRILSESGSIRFQIEFIVRTSNINHLGILPVTNCFHISVFLCEIWLNSIGIGQTFVEKFHISLRLSILIGNKQKFPVHIWQCMWNRTVWKRISWTL